MPLLRLSTSAPVSDTQKSELLPKLSRAVVDATGKPERYVMVTIDACAAMMGGTTGPAAFVDIRGIGGLGGPVNKKLSETVCALLKDALNLPGDRVYLNFTDVAAKNWGWDGSTFG